MTHISQSSSVSEYKQQLRYSQFPWVLASLCCGLFLLFWVLALAVDSGLKPLHYTLFNFFLIAILALQKYHRLELDGIKQQYQLTSIGLLSGVRRWQGSLDDVSGLHIEPGFGGVKGSGGRLLLKRVEQTPLILSSTDILPGSHKELEGVAITIEQWLADNKEV